MKHVPAVTKPSASLESASLVELAVEHWRLALALESLPGGGPAPARHAVRRIGDILGRAGLQALSLDGQPFDPGMAATVIDRSEDPDLPPGKSLIVETLSPQVLQHGVVVRPAEVVVVVAVAAQRP